ncbi:MAG: hypothetical protein IKA75_01315 [Bacteroidaceae bacterium]|nr:hypothetical protein [Bacteroidaceae bacterium]
MKTILIRLKESTGRTDLPKLYEESIHIRNPKNKQFGWFAVKVTGDVTISLNAGSVKFKHSTSSMPAAKDSTLTCNTKDLTVGIHYFYIEGAFDGLLTFSDIRMVEEFDATNAGSSADGTSDKWCGLYLPVNDLIKLSLVKVLLVRYSLVDFNQPTVLDLRPFQNLTKLYIGTPSYDTNLLDEIIMEDTTMRQLVWLNTNVNRLPSNLDQLTACAAIYLQGFPSWEYLRNKSFTGSLTVYSNITIGSTDESDFASIVNFLYANQEKFINITLSKEYEDIALDSSYQSQLVAICGSSATNGGSLKFGSKTATINGTTISLS